MVRISEALNFGWECGLIYGRDGLASIIIYFLLIIIIIVFIKPSLLRITILRAYTDAYIHTSQTQVSQYENCK